MTTDGLDILGINDELRDEERLVRDSVARFPVTSLTIRFPKI